MACSACGLVASCAQAATVRSNAAIVKSSRFIGSSGGADFSGKQKKFWRPVFFRPLSCTHLPKQSKREQEKKMKKMFGVSAAVVMLAFASVASAATSSGTLTVTGTVESSISLTIESAGGT